MTWQVLSRGEFTAFSWGGWREKGKEGKGTSVVLPLIFPILLLNIVDNFSYIMWNIRIIKNLVVQKLTFPS